ncbi:hypothetical protein QOZ80_8BG0646630 [Eleusine coracana subsp. coracana]|nr:hypothetical protein QOZ80_8BG0646630 [Eleusine coracana subsp. coracana]
MILDLGPSEILSILQSLCITCISLQVSSACAAGVVNVWAEHGDDKYAIGTLSPEAPIVALQPHFLVAGDNWVVRHDAVAATVRFHACVPDPPPPSVAGEDEDGGEWEEEEEEVDDEAPREEFRPATEEEDAEQNDSDNDEYEDDEEEDEPPPKLRLRPNHDTAGESSSKNNDSTSLPLVAAPPGTILPAGGQFLGPAQFAAVENTAAFTRVAADEGSTSTNQDRNKEIVVLYRYTRFSRTWSGRKGVEPCRRTKLHRLRFNVPPAGDVASSMAWAGASLGSLVYPALFHGPLQQLWTTTMDAASIATIPPRATRVHVVVGAAILRREDHTAERMEHMRPALETLMQEAWPELYYHVSMDLDLPEPVLRRKDEDEQGGGGEDDDARPAKQMKIVVDEVRDCCVCFDPLENGLAAWPGCRHVFHGECLQGTLARSDKCPLCRMNLCAASASTS